MVLPHATGVEGQWCRKVMNDDIQLYIQGLPPDRCDAVEVSGDWHRRHPWRTYESLSFPDFDLCRSKAPRVYDVVICEQVLEHVVDPWGAARTLYQLCKPGGHVVVSTPFLIRLHGEPGDYWRFTSDGLRSLLAGAGLDVTAVKGWGNRSCVRGSLRRWLAYKPWHSLRNEEAYPVAVWAFARRTA